MARIAVVGMACRYPDARTPSQLWELVLHQRRAFRRMPAERMNMEDYYSSDRSAADRTYSRQAALIEDYEFDRVRFRVTGDAFRSADPAHWLALDIASQALTDAGFEGAAGLPRETTGVILANTLTGDASRAGLMRLRWPYVRRVLAAALQDKGWANAAIGAFLDDLEETYKAPFAPIGEESLAGGLSNTIAGRICNHFDFKGCGYTVDGACASSLLAISGACTALEGGDLDVALAGGVDLSLDPFELVGFAKAGALAEKEMRVYDARSQGFWPGEGCGFVVLMRLEDALAQKRRIYAVVRGWGLSSDGGGGITRPEADGQLLALARAYQRAGFGIDTVDYFEGHGTGTSVGDATELTVLTTARRRAKPDASPAVIGTIKANIGHTKAAAGLAGFIKAALVLRHRLIPPMTGCTDPHSILREPFAVLRPTAVPLPWPSDGPARAAVSAMGFGGVNTHVVLESSESRAPAAVASHGDYQDVEIFLFAGPTREALAQRLLQIVPYAARLSRCELTDLAAVLHREWVDAPVRAAIVAGTPDELSQRLAQGLDVIQSSEQRRLDPSSGLFFSESGPALRIGFAFTGQGSPAHRDGGLWRSRFEAVRNLYDRASLPTHEDEVATQVAQPAIVTASLAGLTLLRELGIEADAAIGHSLGELTALHWAGAMDAQTLLQLARVRGQAMADVAGPSGAMLAVLATPSVVEPMAKQYGVQIAAYNTPKLTVVSGESCAIESFADQATRDGIKTTRLRVSHAFHSPLVAPAAGALDAFLANVRFSPLCREVYSTITGAPLAPDEDGRALLVRQVTHPVRFVEAVAKLAAQVDLVIEVGPGSTLAHLIAEQSNAVTIALDSAGQTLAGLLNVIGAAFVSGHKINFDAIFHGRFSRPFDLNWRRTFLVNPCELAPTTEGVTASSTRAKKQSADNTSAAPIPAGGTPLEVVTRLVARRAELPEQAVHPDSRLLADLHLNSIMVGQVVAEASRHLGLPPPVAPTEFATQTVGAVAGALEGIALTGGLSPALDDAYPHGVDVWYRAFTQHWVPRTLSPGPRERPDPSHAAWRIIAPSGNSFAEIVHTELTRRAPVTGIVMILPNGRDESSLTQLLEATQAAIKQDDASYFVLVQEQGGAEGFIRTLTLEAPQIHVRIITLPMDAPFALNSMIAEIEAPGAYREVCYDALGQRWEPIYQVDPLPDHDDPTNAQPIVNPLSHNDVLLVTGGGKGIAAESALAIAREAGTRVAILGRSNPTNDAELTANLARFRAAGVEFLYLPTDVTQPGAVQQAVQSAQKTFGPITAVLHGAGVNHPRLIQDLTLEHVQATIDAKVKGLRHVLSAVDPQKLRLLVTFGSIIARAGLPGEADYALANEWLARETEDWKRHHPHCRCHCLEWSVWSGAGMGERLGRIESLVRHGVSPIPVDQGVRLLLGVLKLSGEADAPVRTILAGRFGSPPTMPFERATPPFLRFLERLRIDYPGVELVADSALSISHDSYVNDHVFAGERLFPAVMGLEAMAQAAMAVTGRDRPPCFRNVSFDQPIVLPADGSAVTLRVAALVQNNGDVDVVLRCSTTGFAVDHFRACCRLVDSTPAPVPAVESPQSRVSVVEAFTPNGDLYGRLLFHGRRFQRVKTYHDLHAHECLAELADDTSGDWFARQHPQRLVLDDPAARDAAIHAIQACIPHATILPTGVDCITRFAETSAPCRYVRAIERKRDADRFIYDAWMLDQHGRVLERWDGLRLRVIQPAAAATDWPAALLAPYFERRLADLLHTEIHVALHANGVIPRPQRTDRVFQQLLAAHEKVHRRADGKPVHTGGRGLSAAHARTLTLAVVGNVEIGCDAETVSPRTDESWADLLGPSYTALSQQIAKASGEDRSRAATRVWAALEALKKAGRGPDAPLVLDAVESDGWIVLRSGSAAAATYAAPVRESNGPTVFAFACDSCVVADR